MAWVDGMSLGLGCPVQKVVIKKEKEMDLKESVLKVVEGIYTDEVEVLLSKEELKEYLSAKAKVSELGEKIKELAETVVDAVKEVIDESEDEDVAEDMRDCLTDWAQGIAYDLGLVYEDGEFWVPSTCY